MITTCPSLPKHSPKIKLKYLALFCLCMIISTAYGQLSVSENGRYLVKEDGTPFWWLGDTGWGLFQKINREEVDFYLSKRASQGFTVVHAAAIHKNPFILPELENIYGDKAFANASSMTPLITEGNDPDNETAYDYWDHIDYVVDKAQEYGIHIVFLPLFGMSEGEGYNLINADNAYAYGKFLGERYQDKTNIIWCIGGDVLAENEQNKKVWNILARSITEAVAGEEDYSKTLMTYHVRGGYSSSDFFPQAPWIDFHMLQTWDSYTTIYDMVSRDYQNDVSKPVLHGEGAYEDGPEYPTKPITPHKIRKQAYWATFAGGMHTYGNSNVWSFGTNAKYVTQDWKEAIDSEGAKNLSVYFGIFQSLKWWEFVPDSTIIIEGLGDKDSLNVAMRSTQSEQILLYLPEPAEIVLDLEDNLPSGNTSGTWIHPATAEEKKAGKFKAGKNRKLRTPSGWTDALLLIGTDR